MKKNVLVPALVFAAVAAPATSMADVTGNIGYVSDYVFRGIYQTDSSAYAGVDWSGEKGMYVGTWWADVGTGTETDIYFGWTGGSDDVKYKIGYTGYRYLDKFDADYDEVNLGLYAGIFALDIAAGNYDGNLFAPGSGNQNYVFTSLTFTPKMGPYYKIGQWSGDYKNHVLSTAKKANPDGSYLEVGYSYTFEDQGIVLSAALDYSPSLVVSPIPSGANGKLPDYEITFGIKKNFEMKKK